ncbi:MAG: Ribonuclease Y [Parcubacteria group bacterium GW2011_GWA1_33_6]|uniref:Ribonuclease Y n=1 Tax=Candidatus Staskawiczbacteria bacterium RIFCSPHIGHO2_02_FULL_33_16 TaxID=1802204 RepID=A0A1G2HX41_9BACT|nr:MAG: Ribonuclease Y [Parcubacteria group bacterium GW2011_GWA1_33_6]OGZ66791.1 MAG: ribonuclease Y [Candidatus Staskawiczbacteria bacterium RIFCSPHIGHO2_02_FULL_33_16]OGZ70899.1 MAG: ribonuclease Y [Candidatus Staskawiczbacteria bacterium RIFCSPLOWO2_01_FULL_33_13]
MDQIIIIFIAGFLSLVIGCVIGYYVRQSIAKQRAGSLEAKLQKKVLQVKEETTELIKKSEAKASDIIEKAQKDTDERRREFLKAQQVLLDREKLLETKVETFDKKETELQDKTEKLKSTKDELDKLRTEAEIKLEKVASLSREDAKKELLTLVEIDSQKDILERIKKMEESGKDTLDIKAREIVTLAIQKCAVAHTQELSTTVIVLPSEDIKGRIIGKEGRNIKAFEKITGVELILDEAPESVVISCFNPIRRQIAKIALDKLILDGRIQPAKIEEKVAEATEEISKVIKQVGEKTIYDMALLGVNEKLVQILGRLHYRTSYGQNVLQHSMEVALIAETIADELGANSQVAKRGGLFHDIGKAIDQQIQGSHIEIGIKILEKFGESEAVIHAMRTHHGDYPVDSIEAVIVTVADGISASRPGARKDSIENYLQRLKALEDIGNRFEGVEKTYAIQAGREIRVFVKSDKVDDLGVQKMARQIAANIEEELKYPGEIKVTVIRENRVVEYAR